MVGWSILTSKVGITTFVPLYLSQQLHQNNLQALHPHRLTPTYTLIQKHALLRSILELNTWRVCSVQFFLLQCSIYIINLKLRLKVIKNNAGNDSSDTTTINAENRNQILIFWSRSFGRRWIFHGCLKNKINSMISNKRVGMDEEVLRHLAASKTMGTIYIYISRKPWDSLWQLKNFKIIYVLLYFLISFLHLRLSVWISIIGPEVVLVI